MGRLRGHQCHGTSVARTLHTEPFPKLIKGCEKTKGETVYYRGLNNDPYYSIFLGGGFLLIVIV